MRCPNNCQLAAAATQASYEVARLAFCPDCGYPLARASSEVNPTATLPLPEGDTATIEVTIHSHGDGVLYYAVNLAGGVRFRVADGGSRGHLGPREQRRVVLEVRAEDVPPALRDLEVEVYTLTRGPMQAGARRVEPVEDLWELKARHSLRLERLEGQPLLFTAEHLLFGREVDTASFRALNYGSLEAHGTLDLSNGYELAVNGGSFGLQADLVVPPAAEGVPGVARIHVRATSKGADRGWLTYHPSAGSKDTPREVELERLKARPAEPPQYRYTVGIDFGTSKTAVAWLDNLTLGGKVRLVEWPSEVAHQADRRYLPSAVLLAEGEGAASYGRRALTAAHRNGVEVRLFGGGRQRIDGLGWLFVGMKMHLLSQEAAADGPSPREAAVRFLRYVLSHLKNEPLVRDRKLDLSQTMFVLTLPVLDAGPEQRRQSEQTRAVFRDAAAEVGLNLAPDQVQCHAEPFCAAVDHANALRPQDTAVGARPEWLLVFDCGAGTTDLSAVRVKHERNTIRFLDVLTLGYRWGGDMLDDSLRRMLINEWVAPAGAAGQSTPRYLEVAEGAPGPDPLPDNEGAWQAYFQEAESLRFRGGQAVSQAELLGFVSQFKERHFTEAAAGEPSPASIALADPVAGALGESGIGDLSRAGEVLDLAQFAERFGHQFSMMFDEQTGPLGRVFESKIKERLGGDRIRHVFLVGGGTLVCGCREYVAGQRLEFGELADVDRAWRRFHVARGAAQMLKVQVGTALPEPAAVEMGTWDAAAGYRPGPEPTCTRVLPAGSPPSEDPDAQPAQMVLLENEAAVVVARLLLGGRVLQQVPVSVEDVNRALAAHPDYGGDRSWGRLLVESYVRYRPGRELALQLHLGIDDDDTDAAGSQGPSAATTLVPPEPVKLPVFEE